MFFIYKLIIYRQNVLNPNTPNLNNGDNIMMLFHESTTETNNDYYNMKYEWRKHKIMINER